MKRAILAGLAAAAIIAAPVHAQGGIGGDSYQFLKAVKDRDVLKAKGFVDHPGSTVVNTKDGDSGETGLHIVTRDRDGGWINFLIAEGADVNARDRDGNTPLILAATQRFGDGIRLLIAGGAQVNAQNRNGETALIKAVAAHDLPTVRLLMENGADPDKTDNVAGFSARDYAKQDRRSTMIARVLDEGKPAHAAAPVAAKPPATPPVTPPRSNP